MKRWGNNPIREVASNRVKHSGLGDKSGSNPRLWKRGDIILYNHPWFGPIAAYCVTVDFPIAVLTTKFIPTGGDFLAVETMEVAASACRRIWPEE